MKRKQTTLTLALGSAIAAAMVAGPVAAGSVFSAQALNGGYMVADAGKPADKAQEGKCAGQAKAKEGNCGTKVMGKGKEGKCGEGKCGNTKPKAKEGNCGAGAKAQEGKCAANKK